MNLKPRANTLLKMKLGFRFMEDPRKSTFSHNKFLTL